MCRVSRNTTCLYNIVGPNMLPSRAAEGSSVINSFEHVSSANSPKLGKEPVTPELEQQTANRSRFGVPTPDTTPESVRVAPGNRRKQVFVHRGCPRDIRPATPSISSKAPSIEETIDNRENYSPTSNIHSDASEDNSLISEGLSLPPTPPPYLDLEENQYSASVLESIYDTFISFLNLATQRKSRADDARVQSAIGLIRAIPTSRRTRVGNLTRTLTAKQYGELIRAIEESEDDNLQSYFIDELRFDYTRHKKRLEIRMPTSMHDEVGEWIKDQIRDWIRSLQKSTDSKVSSAAETVVSSGHTAIKFPFARGESDSKSPDLSMRHTLCQRKCKFPTIVVEIAWSQDEEDVRNKAEFYIRRSEGKIRTVVAIDMRKMYLAEKRNENRLYQMYLAGEVDERVYSYPHDENNETSEASILVWKAKTQKNGKVKAVCVQNKRFRDEAGNAIDSVSLRLPLQDFICENTVNSPAGDFEAPPLEISLKELNDMCIQERLSHYRQTRSEEQKRKAEKEREKQAQERTKQRSKRKEAKSRGASDRTPQEGGLMGRMRENGRLVSARIVHRKLK
ncbi:hypothetical protein F4825DRAFT_401515 [Nemania diffusa]|nr:hypothetical protein F4825DRAFT_401515 [Nemania diffusa]